MSANLDRARAAASAPAGPDCVGFADCPCRRCAATRYVVTHTHPSHDPRDHSYCASCRFGSVAP